MPVNVVKTPPDPIVTATLSDPFVAETDMPVLLREIKALREQETRQVVVIIDMSAVQMNFGMLTDALALAREQIRAEQAAGAVLPSRYLFVGSHEIIRLAADAMTQAQYGGVGGQLFASYDEALAHARTLTGAA